MSIAGFRKSRHGAAITVIVTLASYLGVLLPPRVARASDGTAGTVQIGGGGTPSLAGSTPGGNAIEAMAAVDPSTGAAQTSFPFQLPTARGEAQPSLALRYNSSNGLGFAGMGWTLNVSSIVRKGHAGVPRFQDAVHNETIGGDYETDDYYIDGRLLIPITTSPQLPGRVTPQINTFRGMQASPWALYRAEVDDGARYFFDGLTWIQQTKSGHLIQFGVPIDSALTPGVELADSTTANTLTGAATNRIYRWDIVRDSDAIGNTVYYAYSDERQLSSSWQSSDGVGIQYLTDIYDTSTQAPNQSLDASPPATSAFAHHVRLNWGLAQYPSGSPTSASSPPYAYSPIWKALPFAQLTSVFAYSAQLNDTDGSQRKLVRAYQLSYTYNDTLTRAYLSAIQPIGDCLSAGQGPVAEDDGSPAAVASIVNACHASQPMPATTYTYYGVSSTAPSSLQAPTILTPEHDAYWLTAPVMMLADLDGDSVDEAITGNAGLGVSPEVNNSGQGVPASPIAECSFSCTVDSDAQAVLTALQLFTVEFDMVTENAVGIIEMLQNGPFSAYPNCTGCQVYGPTTQGYMTWVPQNAFPPAVPYWISYPVNYDYGVIANSVSRKLTTTFLDDALWGTSILGDWTSSGVLNVLDVMYILPPAWKGLVFSPGAPRYDSVAVSQFINVAPGSEAASGIQLQTLTLPQADIDNLHQLMGTGNDGVSLDVAGTPLGYPGSITPTNAVDLDGDGLPDIALVINANFPSPLGSPLEFNPYFSARDRQGLTHPLALRGQTVCTPTTYDPTTWLPTTQQPSLFPINETNTDAVLAYADMDGDGVADLMTVNKSTGSIATDTQLDAFQHYTYLDFNVMTSRGDGRFGVPGASTNGCPAEYGGAIPTITAAGAELSDSLGTEGHSIQQSIVRFGDLNGDGFADYAVLDQSGLSICLRYGGAWDNARYHCVKDTTLVGTDQQDGGTDQANIHIGDLDGSGINQVLYVPQTQGGTVDVVVNSLTGLKATIPAAPGPPQGTSKAVRVVTPSHSVDEGILIREGLLQSMSNGVGAKTTFDHYATVSNDNAGKLPVPAWVVKQTTTSTSLPTTGSGTSVSGQSVSIQKNYTYGAPIYDPVDRKFLGFQSVTETTSGDFSTSNAPGTVVTTTFATQTCQYNSSCSSPNIDNSLLHATRGLPAIVEVSENSTAGTKFYTTLFTYTFQTPYTGLDQRPGKSVLSSSTDRIPWPEVGQSFTPFTYQPITGSGFPEPTVNVPTSYPSGGPVMHRSVLYDGNGNPTTIDDSGLAGVDPIIRQVNTYQLPAGDTTGFSFRLTQSLTGYTTGPVTSGAAGVREYDFTYDAYGRLLEKWTPFSGAVPLPAGFGGPRPAPAPPDGATLSLSHLRLAVYSYDPTWGVVQQSGTEENLCGTTIDYDTGFHQLPITVTRYPSGCATGGTTPNSAGKLATSHSYDRGLGLVTSETTPANELTTYSYDDFGRVRAVFAPDPDPLAQMATVPALQATYDDTGPIRHYRVNTADSTSGGDSFWVTHDMYLDGLGQTRARIDLTGTSDAPQYVLSGVSTIATNGRMLVQYRPMQWNGGGDPASSVGQGQLPALPANPTTATFVYDGLGRVVGRTDFAVACGPQCSPGKPSKAVYHTAALSVDLYDEEQLLPAGPQAPHAGAFTTLTKDGHGRAKSSVVHMNGTAPDIVTTYDSYLATGELTAVTTGGVQRTMSFDSLGRMVQNIEPNAGTNTYAHDFDGRLVATSDGEGCGENLWYDGIGRLLAEDYVPCGLPGQGGYTPADLATGRGTEAFYAYDSGGRLSDQWDLASHVHYQYDGRSRASDVSRNLAAPIVSVDVNGGYEANTYDLELGYTLANRVSGRTVSYNGNAIASDGVDYTFDGRMVDLAGFTDGSVLPDGYITQVVASVEYNPDGTPSQIVYGDAAGTTEGLSYYANGRLSNHFHSRAAGGLPNGAWASTTPPPTIPLGTDGSTTQTGLDDMGITRDAVGNVTGYTDDSTGGWPPGAMPTTTSYTYDNNYRLSSVNTPSPDSYVSPYLHEQQTLGDLSPYALPNQENNRVGNQTYSYDARGNVCSWTDVDNDNPDRSIGTEIYYNAGTGPRSPSAPPAAGPGYDQVDLYYSPASTNGGYVTTDQRGMVYTNYIYHGTVGDVDPAYIHYWDEVGRLRGVVHGHGSNQVASEDYVYDADGNRIRQARGTYINGVIGDDGSTLQVFDMLVVKHATYDASTNTWSAPTAANTDVYLGGGMARMFYDDANVLPQTDGAGQMHTYLRLADDRGSNAFVIDSDSSEVVERTTYQAYGAIDADYRPARWNYNREDFKFTGNWDNAEVGLVYMNARYYSPILGRFISPDPMAIHGVAGDANPYAYGYGNPINNIDPSGLWSEDDTRTLITGVAIAGIMAIGFGSLAATAQGAVAELGPFATIGDEAVVAEQAVTVATSTESALGVGAAAAASNAFGLVQVGLFNGDSLAAQLGRLAHTAIGYYYRTIGNPDHAEDIYVDKSIRKITGNPLASNHRPDIYDAKTGGVYEIKSARSFHLAQGEAFNYAMELKLAGERQAWLGSSTQPGTSGIAPTEGGEFRFWSPRSGVILYDYFVGGAPSPIVAVDPSPADFFNGLPGSFLVPDYIPPLFE